MAVGFHGSCVTGAIAAPGTCGAGPNGKSPIPTDVTGSQRIATYAHRIQLGIALLGSTDSLEVLADQKKIRPIFPDFVGVQRAQASDYASVVHAVYKYSVPRAQAMLSTFSRKRMLYHLCGPSGGSVRGGGPRFPSEVRKEWATQLATVDARARRQYLCDPPPEVWVAGQLPKFPADSDLAVRVVHWWGTSRIPSEVYELWTY